MPVSADTSGTDPKPRRLGPYEILGLLGTGGMGEVYRARDTKLGREVAIKVIPEAFAQDTDRLARFAREAQVLAALNHPNIAAIYGIEERALVMELVEGPTLGERIGVGPIPLGEALPFAFQMADAMEYAHEKGIIHRDLKPANIKITPEGRVKVLDFGLAKALANDAPAGDPKSSPTLTMRGTQAGFILGTAAYMAPEQARGHNVDRRADIWAFGVVLYEMLTGRQLFSAPTISDSLAAVLTREPEWDRVPAGARAVLRRCLQKDAKRRLRDAADVRLLLEEIPENAPAEAAPSRRPWPTYAAIALLLTTLLLAFVLFRAEPPRAAPARFVIPVPDKAAFILASPRVSPDGRHVAFTAAGPDGQTLLWIRALESLEARSIAGTENAMSPFWSPDSRFLAFGAAGKLKKVALSGGPVQTVCDAPDPLLGGDWNRDGVILLGGATDNPLFSVSAAGGIPSPVMKLDRSRHEAFHSYPSFLPDGRHFVYLKVGRPSGIYLGSLDAKPDGPPPRQLLTTQTSGAYVSTMDRTTGYLLFVSEGTLMAQRFDSRRLELQGEPVPLVEQVLIYRTSSYFSASQNGVLVYRSGGRRTNQLAWFDRQGKAMGPLGEAGSFGEIALSPDGTRVALSRRDSQGAQIWLMEHAGATQLTFPPTSNIAPVWSPEGGRIVFASFRDSAARLALKASNGAGGEEVLSQSSDPKYPSDWSRDGRFLLYSSVDAKTKSDLWVLPEPTGAGGGRKPEPYLLTEANESQGHFSPDGRWVAYVSDETGRPEIYVQPFPAPAGAGGKWKISREGGIQPLWRRDGKELFYFSQDRKIMAVDVATSPNFKAGVPMPLFVAPVRFASTDQHRYAVSADGKQFLFNTDETVTNSLPITVVLNWTAALDKSK
jgi:Tol biopolymer transport system component/predicted Ser/Thr protein kinase